MAYAMNFYSILGHFEVNVRTSPINCQVCAKLFLRSQSLFRKIITLGDLRAFAIKEKHYVKQSV